MQKLLERESQRCQDLLNSNDDSSKLKLKLGTDNDDSKLADSSKNSEEIRGLESIIKRQNEMIESYRLKLIKLEEEKQT